MKTMQSHFLRTSLLLALGFAANGVNAKPFIYATTSDKAITIIDVGNNSIVGTIPLPDFGSKMAVTPDGKFVYVMTGRSITVIDTAERRLHITIPLCCNQTGIASAPDGGSVYVTGLTYNSVAVIDTKTNYVSAIFSAGISPQETALAPNGTAYVINSASKTVSVIDTATKATTATIPVGDMPLGVSVSLDGGFAYVANGVSENVSVIDTTTRTIVAIIPVGAFPLAVVMGSNGLFAYVPNHHSNSVSVIDTFAKRVTATIGLNGGPGSIVATRDGAFVYVANGKEISVVSTQTNGVVASIPMPQAVNALALIPESGPGAIETRTMAPPIAYTITNLGIYANPTALNDSGQVVGTTYTAGPIRAFLWDDGAVTDLGTFGGIQSYAGAINDSKQVAGYAQSNGPSDHAFIYKNQALEDLNPVGSNYAQAYGINRDGQIVGLAQAVQPGPTHAFLFSANKLTDLGTLGGVTSYARAINNAGEIVGTSQMADKTDHAFLYSNSKMIDLGTLGGASWAQAINNSGQIAGYSEVAGIEVNGEKIKHAFLYSKGKMADLGTPSGGTSSWAYAINDAGQVVGMSYVNGGQRAFLFSEGRMQDLNNSIPPGSGWILSEATAINNKGQIAGSGLFHVTPTAYLLTPIPTTQQSSRAQLGPAPSSTSYFLEAESGIISSPMTVFTDEKSGERYISSSGNESAKVSFVLDLREPATYVLWTRIKVLAPGAGQFSIAFDGQPAEIYDAGDSKDAGSWRWARMSITGNDRLTQTPRLFELWKGFHTMIIKTKAGLGGAIKLDRVIVTADLKFDPNEWLSGK